MSSTVGRPGTSDPTIVIVDRLGSFHSFARQVLAAEGYDVRRAVEVQDVSEALVTRDVSAVVVDVCTPDGGMLREWDAFLRSRPGAPLVVVTGCQLMDAAARTLYPEAAVFLRKPCSARGLMDRIREACEVRAPLMSSTLSDVRSFHGIVAASSGMRRVIDRIREVAPTDATVLVTGETGTGKELVARAIHECSPRADGPYVVVDTLALSESVLESELFGHERGAFTGAVGSRPGLFEAADGGTIFLDEIGEVSASVQVRLLRAIQEREVRRVGAVKPTKVDVRVVAATQWPLQEQVTAGRLRADLYYRLAVYEIRLPPLRERLQDIPALSAHVLGARSAGRGVRRLTPLAQEILAHHDWPGNVRELFAVLEGAIIGASGESVGALELPEPLRVQWRTRVLPGGSRPDRTVLTKALRDTGGHRSDAAEVLGVSRTTLWRWMKRHDL